MLWIDETALNINVIRKALYPIGFLPMGHRHGWVLLYMGDKIAEIYADELIDCKSYEDILHKIANKLSPIHAKLIKPLALGPAND